MSFGGILAQALAGGTAAIGKQAGDDLEAQRRAEMMRQQADIAEQTEMRLMELRKRNARDQTLWETSGEGGAAKRAYRQGELADTNAADIDKARGMIPVQQEALKAKASTEQAITKEQAADPIYLGSIAKIKLADPEVAARIAASRASAGASAASAAESRERTEGLKLGNADKRKLDGLYGEAVTILADASISDEERAKRYGKVQTQIVLMKSKNGQAPGRDPDTGYETVEQREYDANGQEVRKTTRKEPIRAGQGGGKPTEQQAHAEAEAAIKSGAPRDAVNARLAQAGFKPLGGSSDKPGMAPGAERAARTKPAPDYRLASDGSGRMVDVTTGRTLTPEQSAILQKMQRGEPTTPRERAILVD